MKYNKLTVSLSISIIISAISFNTAVADNDDEVFINRLSTIEKNQGKIDCSDEFFHSQTSTKSLMSWSKRYHKDIKTASSVKPGFSISGDMLVSGGRACLKTVQYRGTAHCQQPNNIEIKTALNESLTLCQKLLLKTKPNTSASTQ